jgi:hypothetical protein
MKISQLFQRAVGNALPVDEDGFTPAVSPTALKAMRANGRGSRPSFRRR